MAWFFLTIGTSIVYIILLFACLHDHVKTLCRITDQPVFGCLVYMKPRKRLCRVIESQTAYFVFVDLSFIKYSLELRFEVSLVLHLRSETLLVKGN